MLRQWRQRSARSRACHAVVFLLGSDSLSVIEVIELLRPDMSYIFTEVLCVAIPTASEAGLSVWLLPRAT